ncbi:chitinase A [Caudoviricetes sp.]|nr:chitinase A [Caudoviricetes sp.]
MIVETKHLEAVGVKDPAKWLEPIREACQKFQINTDKRVCAFLAQCAHESGGFTMLTENLNYRASTMAACWPNRFAVLGPDKKPVKDAKGALTPNSFAMALEKKPESIANVCYSNRMGNGTIESGDGWKYRGRGLKQLTGKDNYTRCGQGIGVDLVSDPDKLLEPAFAALSAGWFWSANHCSDFIDRDDFVGLTKKINGGTIGLADREARYKKCLALVG